jgi:glyoxylase-like metal-dependent hydrolase (beta-lactamase superfamily II)
MRIYPLSEGSFTIDQSKVFVPFDTASHNLQLRPKGSILVEIQPFVVVTDNDIILFDTGLGYLNNEGMLQLHDNLMKIGIDPTSVTKVFMSHLHKDHAGGMSYIHPVYEERFISFPYAKYYVQKREFDLAISGNSPSYLAEQVSILEDFSGVVWLTEDEGIIDNLIHYKLTAGHSLYHQVAWIKEEGTTFFFGGDVAPQLQQMKSKFVAKYDLDGKTSMEWRQIWWEQAAKEQWTFAFYHDIQYPTFTPGQML